MDDKLETAKWRLCRAGRHGGAITTNGGNEFEKSTEETDKLDYPENNFDCTLLHVALLYEQYYIAKKLIEKGVFINYNISRFHIAYIYISISQW